MLNYVVETFGRSDIQCTLVVTKAHKIHFSKFGYMFCQNSPKLTIRFKTGILLLLAYIFKRENEMISARDTAISLHTPVTCTVLYEKFPFLGGGGRWGGGGGVWSILGELRTEVPYQEWRILCDLATKSSHWT